MVGYRRLDQFDRLQSFDYNQDLESRVSKYSAPDSSNSFESISLGKISEDVKRHEIGKTLECGLTEQDVRLFKLLKENYILTARELMETCQEYDKYQLEQNTMPANMTQDEDVG